MKKILLAGQNKYWGKNLEETTEFWLGLGINHLIIKSTADTRFIENGKVIEKQFERFQGLQEKYNVKYHLHFYYTKIDGCAVNISLSNCHSPLVKLFTELDKSICKYNLYPLITVHPPIFEQPKHGFKINEQMALKNGKDFFQSLKLKSKLAIETMHDPYRNLNQPDDALLGYKAEHFRNMIGIKNHGLCIDVGHLNMAEESLEKFLELPYPVYSLHLHGNDGISDQHQIADKTNVKNFKLIKEMLKRVRGPVVLENRNYNYSLADFRRLFEIWEFDKGLLKC